MPDQETAWTTFFLFVLVRNLFYSLQRGSNGFNGFITGKTILFQGSREGPTFSIGVHIFQGGGGGGGQMLISIETHVTCDFPGGRTPYPPPLDPHLTDNVKSIASTNTVCDRYTNGINS